MRKNEHVHMSKGKLERWTMCGKTLNKHPHMLISKDVKKVSCGRCLDCIRRQELSKSRKREGSRLKKLRRIVFSLWREAVWLIWDGKCALCGRPTNNLNSHHFFPKGAHSALEFEPYCGVLLCYGCHIGKVHRGGDVERLRDIYIGKIGEPLFEGLKKRSYEIAKGGEEWLTKWESYLTDFVKVIKDQKGIKYINE